jgi:hypothetical protein
MITVRKASERGHADHGWLDTHHTFSFDDRVAGGQGFGSHPHRDMEILSYVLEGGLAHRDSTGTDGVIRPGDLQRMSAGTGVVHSEFNASKTEPVHFLQIWLIPTERGIKPGYEQKTFADADKQGRLRVVASPDGRDGSITIHTDAAVHAGLFDKGQAAELALAPGRHAWVHVARGTAKVNGHELGEGDGLSMSDERAVSIEGVDHAELLVFELA